MENHLEEGGLFIEDAGEGRVVLRLFVAGSTPKSTRAVSNLRTILEGNLHGRYELEVIDLYQQPELAKKHGLLAAPTALKTEPLPVRRIIGDMSDEARVLAALEILKQES
ncbi:circadian clock protein KaiB [bacterium]|nr:MAG: circadian clock protein KaiB [bacterium]